MEIVTLKTNVDNRIHSESGRLLEKCRMGPAVLLCIKYNEYETTPILVIPENLIWGRKAIAHIVVMPTKDWVGE